MVLMELEDDYRKCVIQRYNEFDLVSILCLDGYVSNWYPRSDNEPEGGHWNSGLKCKF